MKYLNLLHPFQRKKALWNESDRCMRIDDHYEIRQPCACDTVPELQSMQGRCAGAKKGIYPIAWRGPSGICCGLKASRMRVTFEFK